MRPYLLAGLILLGFCAQDASASRLICNGEEIAGWLFYCDPEPEPEPAPEPQPEPVTKEQPAPPPPAPMTATEQMEAFRKQADELKHRAILDPTPENVQAYMEINAQMATMASQFAGVWQRVLLETPQLDANIDRPLTQMGQLIYHDQRNAAERQALVNAATSSGFVFVYEDPVACRLCLAQAQILTSMEETFGIEVLAVSADGSSIEGFPDYVVDNGRLEEIGVADLPRPFLALVEPSSGRIELLGGGLLTEDQILQRVYVVREVAYGEQFQ